MTEIGHIRLSNNSNLLQKFKNANLQKPDETNLLEKVDGLDIISFSGIKTSEKFDDVYSEFNRNVPDSTSTIEEKELAISYIDRMLACSDISSELKIYWQNKKDIITQEIQNIKNEDKVGSGEKVEDVLKEFTEFTNEFWNKQLDSSLLPQEYNEYYFAYYNTYISFCDRFLTCTDLTPEQKTEYENMRMYGMRDLNYHHRDLNRYNTEQGNNAEKFDDVFAQMQQNVPDSTTTTTEKELAISYIDRMLSCPDIPNPEYWKNKKTVIGMEIQRIEQNKMFAASNPFSNEL